MHGAQMFAIFKFCHRRQAIIWFTMKAPQEKASKQPRHTPLKASTLSETIFQEVRNRLQRGEIGAEDRVLDYKIALEYNCTRMPVRQALLRLTSEGYLTGTTRGFILPTLTTQDIYEIFEMRRLLEPPAAASVTGLLNTEQYAALTQAYDKARRATEENNAQLLTDANIAFRSTWIGALPNKRLQETIQRFADHAQRVRTKTLSHPATQSIVVHGLKRLLDGFIARDGDAVQGAMQEFVQNAQQQYILLAQEATRT
ncbi:MAG: GntR family transcriptional regulator [Burkholderiaceae bacterium]|nr:MAG: GntR family transcriptional regulator [Burkholderiaceae bacterium]TAM00717.1 MAG: GntR family transcriptional regulator [Pusillimonas sp.]